MFRKKILITGGSGFIGTNLVNYLSKKKHIIINIDYQSYASTKEDFKKIKYKKKYFFYKLNLYNKNKIKFILNKHQPDYIIHLAAQSHVDRSIESPGNFIFNNIKSIINFLNAIKEYQSEQNKKIKIINISTDEVYGSIKKGSASENNTIITNSPYSASKASSDHIIQAYATTYNIKFMTLRLCNNYGPYQFIEKFIPNSIRKLVEGDQITIYGKGNNIREWIYVEDSCKIIEKMIYKFQSNETYNVGSGIEKKNIDIAKKIIEIFYNKKNDILKKIEFVSDRPGHDFRYSINIKKLQKKINFKFTPINVGLTKTLKWYLSNQNWFDLVKKKYSGKRLGRIVEL
jgi:dTDP-glucose 4,6-dehydratase